MLSKCHGTYCLELFTNQTFEVKVGKNHKIVGKNGYYYYIGSAYGPGGLASRIAHHCRPSPRPHWHIDYIKEVAPVMAVWISCGVKHEHRWADILSKAGLQSYAGVGASDCDCASHFFYAGQTAIKNVLPGDYLSIGKIHESTR